MWLERFWQDFAYVARRFRRSPGFVATAVLMIGAAIGINAVIFSVVDALLLRPLLVRNPEGLVQVFEKRPNLPAQKWFDSAFFRLLKEHSTTLVDFACQAETTVAMEQGGRLERVYAMAVSPGFFSVVVPAVAAGRLLAPGDDHAAVLSYAAWVRSFDRDRAAVGRTIRLAGHVFQVVGVAAEGFNGTTVEAGPDVWVPNRNWRDFVMNSTADPDTYETEIFARLRADAPVAQAQQETAALWRRYVDGSVSSPWLSDSQLEVQPIARGVSALRLQFQNSLTLLLAGTVFLLLIVALHVGGLLLARSANRQKEMAVRLAIGASRGRIAGQMLVESVSIAALGGIAGVLLAWAGSPLFLHWIPPVQVGGGELRELSLAIRPDFRVVAFCCALCGGTAVLAALAPAWSASQTDLQTGLKSNAEGGRQSRFQPVLCGTQVALCTVLLLSAALIAHSFSNLRGVNPGFETEHVATFAIDPRMHRYHAAETWALETRLTAGVAVLPGVRAVGIAGAPLLRGVGMKTTVVFAGQKLGSRDNMNTSTNNVMPGYFAAMGIRLLRGRFLSAQDVGHPAPTPVVVNQAFVSRFLGSGDPMGRQFDMGRQFTAPKYTVVGVAADTKYRSLREVTPPIFYTADFGPAVYPESFVLYVRAAEDPRSVMEGVRRVLRSIDPEMPIYQSSTLTEEVDRSLWQERLIATLALGFGVFSLVLSGIGIYSTLAHFVSGRRREIGVRMALGARNSDVAGWVSARLMGTVAAGVGMGGLCFLLLGGWLRGILFGVPLADPVAVGTAICLLVAISIAGAAVPVRRAMRVDPAVSLRAE